MDSTQTLKTEEMLKVMPAGIQGVFQSVFADAELVEEKIAEAKEKWPEATELDAAFGLLFRASYFKPASNMQRQNMYKAWIDEILERVAKGESVQVVTDAERLLLLSETSLATPLSHDATTAMSIVFNRIAERSFPDWPRQEVPMINGEIAYYEDVMLEIDRGAQRLLKSDGYLFNLRKMWDKTSHEKRLSGEWY